MHSVFIRSVSVSFLIGIKAIWWKSNLVRTRPSGVCVCAYRKCRTNCWAMENDAINLAWKMIFWRLNCRDSGRPKWKTQQRTMQEMFTELEIAFFFFLFHFIFGRVRNTQKSLLMTILYDFIKVHKQTCIGHKNVFVNDHGVKVKSYVIASFIFCSCGIHNWWVMFIDLMPVMFSFRFQFTFELRTEFCAHKMKALRWKHHFFFHFLWIENDLKIGVKLRCERIHTKQK